MNNETAILVALHHAKPAQTDQRHRTIFCDAIESAPNPQLVLDEVIRRLGRHRSMLVEIDPRTINRAIRKPKAFKCC